MSSGNSLRFNRRSFLSRITAGSTLGALGAIVATGPASARVKDPTDDSDPADFGSGKHSSATDRDTVDRDSRGRGRGGVLTGLSDSDNSDKPRYGRGFTDQDGGRSGDPVGRGRGAPRAPGQPDHP